MKHELRLADYLEHMQQAAAEAIGFVENMDKTTFIDDRRTQRAVVFNLVVLGEAAGNVLAGHAAFAEQHTEVPGAAFAPRATASRTVTLTSTST